jgi:hypothetical protein
MTGSGVIHQPGRSGFAGPLPALVINSGKRISPNTACSPRMGTLYYGDNLDILRRYLKDETVGQAELKM